MDVSFDPAKRARTLAERGLDFADAGLVFAGVTATVQDLRDNYREDRYVTIGSLQRPAGGSGLDASRKFEAHYFDEVCLCGRRKALD